MGRLTAAAGKILFPVVEGAAGLIVTGYERSAAQRVATAFSPYPGVEAPTIELFRCLGLVNFSPKFVETLKRNGFRAETCFFSPTAERQRLLGLKETVAEAYESLISNPPENVAATVGSSLGAVASVLVMAPAKLSPERRGLLIRRLHRWLPPTRSRNPRAMHELAKRLEGARVVVMGGPLNEIHLTGFGQLAVGAIEMFRPDLFRWLGRGYLRGTVGKTGLYRELGFDLREVVDVVLIGGAQSRGLHGGGPRSVVANACMQVGTRAVSALAVQRARGEGYDGVVTHSSALLGLGLGREIVFERLNHIDMMESPRVAEVIVQFLKRG